MRHLRFYVILLKFSFFLALQNHIIFRLSKMSGVTVFKWKIANLKETCDSGKPACSPIFSLKDFPLTKFALSLTTNNNIIPRMDVISCNVNDVNQMQFCVKMWLENGHGGKFGEQAGKFYNVLYSGVSI
jgi:hypothetical protein